MLLSREQASTALPASFCWLSTAVLDISAAMPYISNGLSCHALHKATQVYKALAVSSPNRTKLGIPWVRVDWPTWLRTPVTLLQSMKSCARGSMVVVCPLIINTFLLCTALTSTPMSQSQQNLCDHRCEVWRNPVDTAERCRSPQVAAQSCFCGPHSHGDSPMGSTEADLPAGSIFRL